MLGYEDANDVTHLQHDPLFKDVLQGDRASRPTISRSENSLDRRAIFELSNAWADNYVSGLAGRKRIVIDVDATDDPTYGNQQMSLFNAYYGQFMLNELFFHDGETGQIILPVLRPGNSHSNKWHVGILKRIVLKIRTVCPDMKIVIRTDSGFRCAPFYELVDDCKLLSVTGTASNAVLKKKVSRAEKAVRHLYLDRGEKHQHFITFIYKPQFDLRGYRSKSVNSSGISEKFYIENRLFVR